MGNVLGIITGIGMGTFAVGKLRSKEDDQLTHTIDSPSFVQPVALL